MFIRYQCISPMRPFFCSINHTHILLSEHTFRVSYVYTAKMELANVETKILANLAKQILQIKKRAVSELDNRMKQETPEKHLRTAKKWVKYWLKSEKYQPIPNLRLQFWQKPVVVETKLNVKSGFQECAFPPLDNFRGPNEFSSPDMQEWRTLWEESKKSEAGSPNPLLGDWTTTKKSILDVNRYDAKMHGDIHANKPVEFFGHETSWSGMGLYRFDAEKFRSEYETMFQKKCHFERKKRVLKKSNSLGKVTDRYGVIWFYCQGYGYGFIKVITNKNLCDQNEKSWIKFEDNNDSNTELPESDDAEMEDQRCQRLTAEKIAQQIAFNLIDLRKSIADVCHKEKDELVYFHVSDVLKSHRNPNNSTLTLKLVAGQNVRFDLIETNNSKLQLKSKFTAMNVKPVADFFVEKAVRAENIVGKISKDVFTLAQ